MIDWDYLAIVVTAIYAAAIIAFICFGWMAGRENERLRALLREAGVSHLIDDPIDGEPEDGLANQQKHNDGTNDRQGGNHSK